jgi:hypothetical protein
LFRNINITSCVSCERTMCKVSQMNQGNHWQQLSYFSEHEFTLLSFFFFSMPLINIFSYFRYDNHCINIITIIITRNAFQQSLLFITESCADAVKHKQRLLRIGKSVINFLVAASVVHLSVIKTIWRACSALVEILLAAFKFFLTEVCTHL